MTYDKKTLPRQRAEMPGAVPLSPGEKAPAPDRTLYSEWAFMQFHIPVNYDLQIYGQIVLPKLAGGQPLFSIRFGFDLHIRIDDRAAFVRACQLLNIYTAEIYQTIKRLEARPNE